jgi:hypothetical protein
MLSLKINGKGFLGPISQLFLNYYSITMPSIFESINIFQPTVELIIRGYLPEK